MEFPKPRDEHRFLERLLGEWVATSSSHMKDYDPEDPAKRWTETVRSMGGLWVVSEGSGLMPNGERGSMLMTVGFDPSLGHYVGTWVGSMMDNLWVYKGWVEPDGDTLVLESEGPSFEDPKTTAVYRDTIRFTGDDRKTFSGSVRQTDGSFETFMSDEFKRVG